MVHEPLGFGVLVFLGASRNHFAYRGEMLGLFWPDRSRRRGLSCLRQAVHRLREVLGPEAVVTHGNGNLSLDPAFVEVDVRRFEDAWREGRHVDALALHGGLFLEGFPGLGRQEFDDWVGGRREELRRMACRSAQNLAEGAEAQGRLAEAAWAWRAAMDLSDCDERLLRRWMTCTAQAGAPGHALVAYQQEVRALARRLDLPPAWETRHLADAIRRETVGRDDPHPFSLLGGSH